MSSKEVAASAIRLALTEDRTSEKDLRAALLADGVKTAVVGFGGEFIASMGKIIEHCVVASKREGVIDETHREQGTVAGAAHEALSQMTTKALGLNVGGKIAIARQGEHLSVAAFFGVGLVHLNDVAIGLGHRVIG